MRSRPAVVMEPVQMLEPVQVLEPVQMLVHWLEPAQLLQHRRQHRPPSVLELLSRALEVLQRDQSSGWSRAAAAEVPE